MFRQRQIIEQLAVPIFRLRIEHLRRTGVSVFADILAGEKTINQVGDEQELVRIRGNALTLMSIELKQGIELEKLNTGPPKHPCARPAHEDFFHHALRSLIAIANRQLNQLAARIDQTVIDAPTIDTNALNFSSQLLSARRGF